MRQFYKHRDTRLVNTVNQMSTIISYFWLGSCDISCVDSLVCLHVWQVAIIMQMNMKGNNLARKIDLGCEVHFLLYHTGFTVYLSLLQACTN